MSTFASLHTLRRAATAARWRPAVRCAVGFALGSLSLSASRAYAQLAVDQIDLVFERGAGNPVRQAFVVTNKGQRAAQVDISLASWDRDSLGRNRFFDYGTGPGSCGRALSIDPLSTRLDSGGTQLVQIRVDTAALPPSECWAVAFVQTVLPGTRRGTHFNLVLRTGVKLYVVPRGATRAGEIVAMQVRPHVPVVAPDSVLIRESPDDPGRMVKAPGDSARKAVADTTRQELLLAFGNSGTRHHVARGSLELRRPDNSVAGRVPLPNLYSLPGTTQWVTVPLPNVPRGRYVALAILDFGGDELAAGQVEFDAP